MHNKLKGKEELVLNLELDEHLLEFRKLEKFASDTREALRSWKAYSHTGNEKNFKAFNHGWKIFLETMGECTGDGPTPPFVARAAADLVKAYVAIPLNKGD